MRIFYWIVIVECSYGTEFQLKASTYVHWRLIGCPQAPTVPNNVFLQPINDSRVRARVCPIGDLAIACVVVQWCQYWDIFIIYLIADCVQSVTVAIAFLP